MLSLIIQHVSYKIWRSRHIKANHPLSYDALFSTLFDFKNPFHKSQKATHDQFHYAATLFINLISSPVTDNLDEIPYLKETNELAT
ncbi:MAG TPA: hypothetical protein DCK95_07825 [Anaerolineaceae bacterium]|nr:hypothetical protein [Anaerolineaceae bacterium]